MESRLDGAGLFSALSLLGMLVPLLAAFAALDMGKRVQTARPKIGIRWLGGAAIAMGTGIASAHVIFVSAFPLPFPLGYQPWGMLGAWLLAIVVSLVGLGLGGGWVVTLPRVVLGGVALGGGMVGTQVACMHTMGLNPGIEWNAGALVVAWLAAVGLCTAALWTYFWLRIRASKPARHWQASSAALLGAAVVVSENLVIAASTLSEQSFSTFDLRLPSATLLVLASLGSFSLLGMMLFSSQLEARMRASLRRAKGELHKQSLSDPLTELANRPMFESALGQAVTAVDASGSRIAVLFVDLDGFKPINESFGYHSGDRMLREVAQRLRALVKPGDEVARLGTDEFLLLMSGDPTTEAASALANRLMEAVGQPCRLNGREATVSCSVGIALYPEHGPMPSLIANAEAAMRTAKAAGGATFCVFEQRMVSGAREQVELLRDLRGALAKGQLELYYQPKVHAPTGEVTGAEALMRWHHPQRGMISPAVFIPIAERFGLISALGNWVIDEACRQTREWRDAGLRMRVAINLSVHQLRHPDLAERIDLALRQHAVNPDLLTCEITESVAMDDPDGTMRMFEKLAAVGVHISIDDFGTGYSSLSYLRKLPAGEVKIDRGFVLDLETSNDARAVVDAVIKLAQALGLKVVAEGVKTEAQHEILRGLGCDELQGYLFAKPMSAKALALWAMGNVGPRTIEFRESLFAETMHGAMH